MSPHVRGIRSSEVRRTHSRAGLLLVFITALALFVIPLSPADAATGSVSGAVTDAMDEPLAATCVQAYRVSGDQVASVKTDSLGRYRIEGLEAGAYRLGFVGCDDNVEPEFYDDEDSLAEATPITVTAGADTPNIDAQLATGGSISGEVSNSSSDPLSGICVRAYDANGGASNAGVTNASGEYTVGGLASGDYRLEFTDGCFLSSNNNVLGEFYDDQQTLAAATPVSVSAGSDTPDIDAELATGGSISGTVTDSSNMPVAGICVVAFGSNGLGAGSRVSGPDGDYSIGGLKTDDYRIQFWRCAAGSNVLTEFYEDAGTLEEATPVPVTVGSDTPGIDGELAKGGTVSGRLTDETGTPLNDGCVELYDSVGVRVASARTDSNGEYVVNGLETGSYRLRFSDCLAVQRVIAEYFDNQKTRAEATPVIVTEGDDTTGIDAELAKVPPVIPPENPIGPPEIPIDPGPPGTPGVSKAKIGKVTVRGPAKVKRGKRVTFRVKITNSGKAAATGVKLKVRGRGVNAGRSTGTVAAGATNTVKVTLKPTEAGRVKLTFRVTSSNAGGNSAERRITVKN